MYICDYKSVKFKTGFYFPIHLILTNFKAGTYSFRTWLDLDLDLEYQ